MEALADLADVFAFAAGDADALTATNDAAGAAEAAAVEAADPEAGLPSAVTENYKVDRA